jgi:TolA-binding protein
VRGALACAFSLALLCEARADVILSAEALNTALKAMQRLKQEIDAGGASIKRAEALFQLGVQADALASLLSDEVVAHGMQEKPLIDLALSRTKELGVAIAYNDEKAKFFYDGDAFREYLERAPRGPRASDACFWIVENEFYRSSAKDPTGLLAASERKQAFLRRYPRFAKSADVAVFLAIDYRDLYRHYQDAGDAARRDRYREKARAQFRRVVRTYRGTEQAKIAEEMLRRFDAEVRTREGGGAGGAAQSRSAPALSRPLKDLA